MARPETEAKYDSLMDEVVLAFLEMHLEEHDEYGLSHFIGSFLSRLPHNYFNNDQRQFIDYLDLCRESAWDIASALSHSCSTDEGFSTDIMYNPNNPPTGSKVLNEEDQEVIDHYREVHGIDLTDHRINWSFDT